MDPATKYVATGDGVNIAYYTLGEGPPLVILPNLPLSHLQIEWQIPSMRSILEWFGLHHTVIRYDARGMGLSDSHVADDSLDAHVLDLRDLLDRLGIERAALFAASYSGPIALAFAGRFPERVSRLITWCSHASYAEVARGLTPVRRGQRDALIHLAAVDWNLAIHTYIHQALGWDAGDEADLYARLALGSTRPTEFFSTVDRLAGFDATADLPNITAPTLILHRPDFHASSVDVARGLAARIPNSRLVLLGGASVLPFIGDYEEVQHALEEFLDEPEDVQETGSARGGRRSRSNPEPAASARGTENTDRHVHYAVGSHGAGIAFVVIGSGLALVHLEHPLLSHVQLALDHPPARAYYESLAKRHTVVRMDWAGCGLSDRGVADFSLEATLHDIAAVVDRAGLDCFDIAAGGARGTAAALAFAATRPGRVRRMILRSPNAGPDQSSLSWKLFSMMASGDWQLYTETLTHQMSGRSLARSQELAAYMRRCMEQVDYLAEASASFQFDPAPYLPMVGCPVLIVRREQSDVLAYQQVVKTTAALRCARFSTVAPTVSNPFWGDAMPLAALIEEFLDEPDEVFETKPPTPTTPVTPAVAGRPDGLSEREIEVLRLVAAGRTNQQIADKLFISLNTVARHVSNIFDKTGATNRADAASYATRRGLTG